jgi:hypothetical protein
MCLFSRSSLMLSQDSHAVTDEGLVICDNLLYHEQNRSIQTSLSPQFKSVLDIDSTLLTVSYIEE